MKTLLDLKKGESGTIRKINRDQDGAIRQRLLDMGVNRGATLTVERVAPLGDPVEIEIKNYHLAIRKTEAKLIEID